MATIENIITLINNDTTTKFSANYKSKLASKIKNKFVGEREQLFVKDFYPYLNYKTEFIELNKIWKWLGHVNIDECINDFKTFHYYFKEKSDYKIDKENKENNGNILLTINSFKTFCLLSNSLKSIELYDYYIQLENLFNETIAEECEHLKKIVKIRNRDLEFYKNKSVKKINLSIDII
jgi:hypothetical protein